MSEKARIRRGAAPAQRKGKAPARAPARAASALAIPAVWLERGRRVARWALAAGLLGAATAALAAAGVPQMIGVALGEAVGQAGFTARTVKITGVQRMKPAEVYAALGPVPVAMPLLDLDGIRARLLALGWVADARVSRRLPDTLLIDIVERVPAAIWQHRGRLVLIDAAGVPLAPVEVAAMPDLPVVVGPDANRHVGALGGLTAAAPSLKPMLAGATWIGGRRWDLSFQSGETLSLPEGEDEAAAALTRFAELDKEQGLLGEGFVRFDMRVAGKMFARVSREPGQEIEVPQPATAAPPAGVAGGKGATPARGLT